MKKLIPICLILIGVSAQAQVQLSSGGKTSPSKARFIQTPTSAYMVEGADTTGIVDSKLLQPKPKRILGMFRRHVAIPPPPQSVDLGNDIEIPPVEAETPIKREAQITASGPIKVVRTWIEVDYFTYLDFNKDLVAIENWVKGIFNGCSWLHTKADSRLVLSNIFIWDKPSPYDALPAESSKFLNTFLANRPLNNEVADIYHLFTTKYGTMGGRAYLAILNNATYRHGMTNVQKTPFVTPTFNWNWHATAHEIGHNIFANHTQNCNWPSPTLGRFAAIDSCYLLEGLCSAPQVQRIGTTMSYCHLGQGVNINLGFGPLPSSGLQQGLFTWNTTGTYLAPCSLQVDTVYNRDNLAQATISYPANSLVTSWKLTKNGQTLLTGQGSSAAFSSKIGISGPNGVYRFEVMGNGQIHSSDSFVVYFRSLPPLQRPIAGTISADSLKNVDGKFTVTLTQPANSRATSFTLNESGVQIGSGQLNPTSAGTLLFTVSKPRPSAFYTYQANIINAAGSTASNFIQVQTYTAPVVAPACTSFTYTAWSECINNLQTRSVVTSSPSGCIGGSPLLSQACTTVVVTPDIDSLKIWKSGLNWCGSFKGKVGLPYTCELARYDGVNMPTDLSVPAGRSIRNGWSNKVATTTTNTLCPFNSQPANKGFWYGFWVTCKGVTKKVYFFN